MGNCLFCIPNKEKGYSNSPLLKYYNLKCHNFSNAQMINKKKKLIMSTIHNEPINNRKTENFEENIQLESFEIIKMIGEGSVSKIFLVRKKNSKIYYAMKTFDKLAINMENQKEYILNERIILTKVSSPFVANLQYAFQTEGKLFLVLDFFQGGDLFYHLKKDGKFSEEKTRFYISEIIWALIDLHNHKIIYRDLKPENVLICNDGHIKLVDFGRSKLNYDLKLTYTLCGTPEYLAPEVIMGEGHNKSADWWSLGCLIYEFLHGNPPFYDNNHDELFKEIVQRKIVFDKNISKSARNLIENLLKINPNERIGALDNGNSIKKHEFFSKINWDKIYKKDCKPPFIPKLANNYDTTYFDNTLASPFGILESKTHSDYEEYVNFSFEKDCDVYN